MCYSSGLMPRCHCTNWFTCLQGTVHTIILLGICIHQLLAHHSFLIFVVFSFSIMLPDTFLDELKGINSPWRSHHFVVQWFLHPERTMALGASTAIDVDEESEGVLNSSSTSSEQQQQHQQSTTFSSNNSSQQPPYSPSSLSSSAATSATIKRSTISSFPSSSSSSKTATLSLPVVYHSGNDALSQIVQSCQVLQTMLQKLTHEKHTLAEELGQVKSENIKLQQMVDSFRNHLCPMKNSLDREIQEMIEEVSTVNVQ